MALSAGICNMRAEKLDSARAIGDSRVSSRRRMPARSPAWLRLKGGGPPAARRAEAARSARGQEGWQGCSGSEGEA